MEEVPGGASFSLLLCCIDGRAAGIDRVWLCLSPPFGACMVELLPRGASSSKGMKDTLDISLDIFALHTTQTSVTLKKHESSHRGQQSGCN